MSGGGPETLAHLKGASTPTWICSLNPQRDSRSETWCIGAQEVRPASMHSVDAITSIVPGRDSFTFPTFGLRIAVSCSIGAPGPATSANPLNSSAGGNSAARTAPAPDNPPDATKPFWRAWSLSAQVRAKRPQPAPKRAFALAFLDRSASPQRTGTDARAQAASSEPIRAG